MTNTPAPWNWQLPVVGADDTATPEFINWLAQQIKVNIVAGTAVQQARKIIAGTGLIGGGDLSADRTLTLNATLSLLNDIDFTIPPSAGLYLKYNGTKWIAATVGGGTLASLTDVDFTTPPTTGQVLEYNGTKWVPYTLPTGSGGVLPVVDGSNPPVFIITADGNLVYRGI